MLLLKINDYLHAYLSYMTTTDVLMTIISILMAAWDDVLDEYIILAMSGLN